jgi:hypothetical protein
MVRKGGAAARIRGVDKKSLQADKLKEIGQTLAVLGLIGLDQQASALGISRSTTWTVLRAKHKTSGLSAVVINQMLIAPRLPPLVRAKLFEYIETEAGRSLRSQPAAGAPVCLASDG